MRKSFWDKRFPTLLGLLLLIASAVVATFMVQSPQVFESKASSSITISNVQISNQTPTSLSLVFRTNEAASATLHFGTTIKDGSTIFDDRDVIGKEQGLYRNHYFTVTNLNSASQYVFTILTGTKTFDNDGKGFSAKTAAAKTSSAKDESKREPVRGSVVTVQGKDAEDTLVFIRIEGVAPLSTLVKTGKFLLPLANLYTTDLTGHFILKGSEVFVLEAIGSDGTTSTVKIPYEEHADIVKITLGQEAIISPTSPPSSGFTNSYDISTIGNNTSTIENPKEGDFLIDDKPLIRGRASPDSDIEITVESELQTGNVVADENGDWSYQPEKPLEPGKHTISVRFLDGNKVTKVIKNQFEVLASGNQVSEIATPSATATPVAKASVTEVPTTFSLPETGTTLPGVAILSISIFLFVAGTILFFKVV